MSQERSPAAARLRQHAETLVWAVAREHGRDKPTGEDARQALEQLTQVRGEVAALAAEIDQLARFDVAHHLAKEPA